MARGSIRKRGLTWTVVVDTGRDPTTNKRKQLSKGGFGTRKDASRWLTDQLSRLDRGEYVKPSRATYGAFLLDWLPAIRSAVRPSTWESYERNVRLHLLPRLGHIPLQRLGPEHLNAAYADLLGGLSPKTVKYLHAIVHRSLVDAVSWGKVTRNAATLANGPKVGAGVEMTTWTGAQVAAFLDQLQGDRLYAPVLLLVTTGMRRGEVLGLRWRDVDLDNGRAAVRQTLTAPRDPATGQHTPVFGEPKTARGYRNIPLPVKTVAALREWRREQVQERLLVGPGWVDSGLVFTEPDGNLVHPHHFGGRFEARVQRSGLPRIRVHDLRHTFATLALQADVHPKVVQEQLGHSSIAITLDTYSHVTPSMGAVAAETVAGRIFGSA